MLSVWTKHLKDEEQKEQLANSILGSKYVLERAIQILKEEEAAIVQSELNHKIYDSPNWAYKIAHDNGFRAALKTVQLILDLDQKDRK